MKSESHFVKTLRRIFTAEITSSMLDSVDVQYLRDESEEVLSRFAMFEETNNYLRKLEARKAETGGFRGAQEREALIRAQSLATDVRAIVRGGIRILNHLYVSGGLDRLLQSWKRVVEENEGETITTKDLWNVILQTEGMKPFLAQGYLREQTISQITETVENLSRSFQVIEGRLVTSSPCTKSRPRQVHLGGDRIELGAESIWRQGSLDALLAALEVPGPLGAVVFGRADGLKAPQDSPIDLMEVMAVEAALAIEQADALVGLIEHTGLPSYRGSDPWLGALIGVIVLVAVAVGVVITIGCWIGGEDFASDTVCDVGNWMTFIGLFLLLGSSCANDPNCKLEIVVKTNATALMVNDPNIGPLA